MPFLKIKKLFKKTHLESEAVKLNPSVHSVRKSQPFFYRYMQKSCISLHQTADKRFSYINFGSIPIPISLSHGGAANHQRKQKPQAMQHAIRHPLFSTNDLPFQPCMHTTSNLIFRLIVDLMNHNESFRYVFLYQLGNNQHYLYQLGNKM